MGHARHFSSTYAQARARFLACVDAAGGTVETHVNPHALGAEGEDLAMDVARFGAVDAEALLVICSGTHGNEGFCGSACQAGFLAEGLLAQRATDTAVLLVHAVNPYGFSHVRRVTEDNVDLNRNFQDFSRPLPDNAAYREIHDVVVPADWDGPERARCDAVLQRWTVDHGGIRALQAAIAGGQYAYPDGVFFGGRKPTWSNETVRAVMRDHAGTARRLALIDIHTGLGPPGEGELISVRDPGSTGFARAKAWWGETVKSVVGHAGEESRSTPVTGSLIGFVEDTAAAEATAIGLEFGTVELLEVFDALRGDNWLYSWGLPSGLAMTSPLARRIKDKIRDALTVDSDDWKEKVFTRAAEVTLQAFKGLAGVDAAARGPAR
ncbi:MAG: M14 family metallopeptidase [Alsobacter sp.]